MALKIPDINGYKRISDIIPAALGLTVMAPIMVIIAILIKLDSRGLSFQAGEGPGRRRGYLPS